MKKIWFTLRSFNVGVILFLWIGASQSFLLLPSVASAKEGLPSLALTGEGSPFTASGNEGFSVETLTGGDENFFPQIDLEKKKIDFLMHEIEQLDGAKFWRNGTSYSPKEATEYLRMKMRWGDKGRPVRSAKDFIERIGSKSSVSGKPYLIQFADGKKMEMKAFLEQKLSEWKE